MATFPHSRSWPPSASRSSLSFTICSEERPYLLPDLPRIKIILKDDLDPLCGLVVPLGRRVRATVAAAVERIYHVWHSQGQILALFSRQISVKPGFGFQTKVRKVVPRGRRVVLASRQKSVEPVELFHLRWRVRARAKDGYPKFSLA